MPHFQLTPKSGSVLTAVGAGTAHGSAAAVVGVLRVSVIQLDNAMRATATTPPTMANT